MYQNTKYFHVRPIATSIDILFRAEYFDIQDHGWISFWLGDLLVGSCWAQDISQITYMEDGCQIKIDNFDKPGRYGI